MPRVNLAQHEDLIVERLREGGGARTIAGELGCGATTVREYIRKHDLRAAAASKHPSGEISNEELLKEQLRQAEAAMRRNRKLAVAEERIVSAIEDALQTVQPPVHPNLIQPEPEPDAHHRALVCWSDFHGGEVVDSEAVNGLNEYDWPIMEARFTEMLEGMLSHKRYSPELTGLDILLVGDMNSGVNHEELAQTNEFPLAEVGVKVGYLLGGGIERLSEHYADIRVVSVVGNHPRLMKKPAAKNAHDNMDWVSAEVAKLYLRSNDVVSSFVNAGPSALHEIAGLTAYVWHGDGIKTNMPGVPWGGVTRRVNEIQKMRHRKVLDLFYLGHFHDPNVTQGGRINMNGSLKGVDEWVLKNFGGGSPPTQLLQTFDEKASRMVDVKWLTPTTGLPTW